MLVLGALLFGQYGWSVIQFPFPADYGEGPLLAQTMQVAGGHNIYRADLAAPPYTVANYPPLYMLVLVPFAQLLGPAFWYGRLISWLSMIAAALLVGAILRALTGDQLAALLGGLLLLTIPYVSYWDQRPFLEALDRPDFAAILIFRVPGITLEKDRWTTGMFEQIERRYRPAEQIGNTIVYRPKRS